MPPHQQRRVIDDNGGDWRRYKITQGSIFQRLIDSVKPSTAKLAPHYAKSAERGNEDFQGYYYQRGVRRAISVAFHDYLDECSASRSL